MPSSAELSSFGSFQETAVAARDGDSDAQGRLLQAFRPTLLRYAQKALETVGQGHDRPSDVVQDAFWKAWEEIEAFQGCTPEQLEAWLHTIVDRLVWNKARHSEAAKCDVRREVSAEGLTESVRHAAPAAAEVASRSEQRELLRKAMLRLPADVREVLRLKFYEDLPWEEVGRRTGRSAEAARQMHRRAVRKLTEWMQELR